MGYDTLQKAFLRSRANSIEGGTTEVMKNILGERVLGLPGDVRVDRDVPWSQVPRTDVRAWTFVRTPDERFATARLAVRAAVRRRRRCAWRTSTKARPMAARSCSFTASRRGATCTAGCCRRSPAPACDTVVPRLIGFGRSDEPTAREAYTYAGHVAWLRSLVAQLDLRRHVLFGAGLARSARAAPSARRAPGAVRPPRRRDTFLPDGALAGEGVPAMAGGEPGDARSSTPASCCSGPTLARTLSDGEVDAYRSRSRPRSTWLGARQFPLLVADGTRRSRPFGATSGRAEVLETVRSGRCSRCGRRRHRSRPAPGHARRGGSRARTAPHRRSRSRVTSSGRRRRAARCGDGDGWPSGRRRFRS